jgi:hypothetical protein
VGIPALAAANVPATPLTVTAAGNHTVCVLRLPWLVRY